MSPGSWLGFWAGLRLAALGPCHLDVRGQPLPGPVTSPCLVSCVNLLVPVNFSVGLRVSQEGLFQGVPDWLLTHLVLRPYLPQPCLHLGARWGRIFSCVRGGAWGFSTLEKATGPSQVQQGVGQWGRPGARPQWSPGSGGPCVLSFTLWASNSASARWGGWSDPSVLTRVHSMGHGTSDENPRTPMDTCGHAPSGPSTGPLRLTHLR